MFAERYLYISTDARLGRRENLLWPAFAWKFLYPDDDQGVGANLFEEAILGLLRAGVRDVDELASLLALDPELVRYIIAQLQGNGWLDGVTVTAEGLAILDGAEDRRLSMRVGYAFQDAITGAWLPRFVSELPEIAPIGRNPKTNRPMFQPDRDSGRPETPFVLSAEALPSHDPSAVLDAYRSYRRDLRARRDVDDRAAESSIDLQVLERLDDFPTPIYLWCELYRDESELQPWLVSDPFRIRRAASWLRKPLLELAPRNAGLAKLMQRLLPDVPADDCSAEEWLRRVDELAEYQLGADFPFLDRHPLIREHLGRLLRQRKRVESRDRPHGEELGTLMTEAASLLESVLKWLLVTWSIDTRNWPRARWSRAEAEEEFNALSVNCVTPNLVKQLSGQERWVVAKAIEFQDRPLKALLAGALFCANERPDHPLRLIDPASLELERLPALADTRNKFGGHASGAVADKATVLDHVRFSIQWMALFQHWY